MSGIEAIIPWADRNFSPDTYGSFEDFFDSISSDFAAFGRTDLDSILGDDKSILEEFWIQKPQNIQEFLFNFT